jgi:hypothetical protein
MPINNRSKSGLGSTPAPQIIKIKNNSVLCCYCELQCWNTRLRYVPIPGQHRISPLAIENNFGQRNQDHIFTTYFPIMRELQCYLSYKESS